MERQLQRGAANYEAEIPTAPATNVLFWFYFFAGQTHKSEGCASRRGVWPKGGKKKKGKYWMKGYESARVWGSRSFLKINKKCHWQGVWDSGPGGAGRGLQGLSRDGMCRNHTWLGTLLLVSHCCSGWASAPSARLGHSLRNPNPWDHRGIWVLGCRFLFKKPQTA